ncbi:MAG: SUMF1/EgtB/PvdO family nonheme iron enzyme [Microcystis sp. M048S1]|uniref:SUMF1/EgtB/PvdO family nonheme iron enzyme n=1 Tax=unclassified Microcystis TaxID=2643300 RepID=UPI0011945A54|nr:MULTISPECIES: SUMF1/EgtB/PvdO family nonheme iron enzyme [unclassified Microcystis]MCA2720605.1 SUMF1/EgtB/PvdO family nonheme iron enzyme [Microcystis sp. M176S2]MCA2727202.1 SUMF1/EgtB/PvdO family nonheme iron enzyme [Microcystis sp. M166S2]MCA2729085.1 SUMF1/EgtB/PvdO family nonheme iron enzyme [Microcystis sp. M162S2]MCA2747384.1 SUMF1/EgtB/PvdO family nonheme iron enzyme [Microcystis sp. M155S2]MCA2766498.1 SUMF1/EgtB/PvdO family nonheme iron enzyme [Microcystis sp. M152S2]
MSDYPESIRNTSVSDQATNNDALGFEPYVIAIAEFLLHQQTQPPLTLSVEGEWGSGKSSFMKMLEEYLRKKGGRTVWFNAWRHDKAESVWAAFALSFIKQISTPKNWRDLPRIILGYFKLQLLRFNLEKGLFELIKAFPLIIFVICASIAIPFILIIYGVEGINELIRATTSQDVFWSKINSVFKLLFTAVGVTLSGAGIFAGIKSLLRNFQRLLQNPKNNLIKYIEAPDYKKQSAFVEEFHEDFAKIVDAYVGNDRVYVFIDDLDRCEHPKSADLMQAINLMIADDPSVVFILGMDREKVAASLAVKYENILKYLPSETTEIDPDILARRSANKGLAYGYTFIEKFVQLPFLVPQPSRSDFERFLIQLATSTPPNLQPAKPRFTFFQSFWGKFKLALPQRNNSQKHLTSATSNQTSDLKNLSLDNPSIESEQTEKQKAQAAVIKRLEAIQVNKSDNRDSQTVRNVIMMVAPALDYNPRRIKHFINVFRLKVYIANETGLFFEERDENDNLLVPSLTFEQLGKFTAISLKWPLLLSDLENDKKILAKLEEFALRESMQSNEEETKEYDESLRYWGSYTKLKALMAYGHDKLAANSKFSLAEVNVDKLLQVSPRVIRSANEPIQRKQKRKQISQNIKISQNITSLPPDFHLEMVDIPAGKFNMGSNEYEDEKPIHEVIVPAFQIGKYPVTQAQYQAVMEKASSSFSRNPQNPVKSVSKDDAEVFCKQLSKLTGKNYRLPTEAEWEYACRAGTETRFSFGDDESQLGDYAWFIDNSDNVTHPAGQKRPNLWGIYDMHGNVWEWCADKYHKSYVNKPENIKKNGSIAWLDSNINNKSLMIIRGGDFNSYPGLCRSADRYSPDAYLRSDFGFRVVCDLPQSVNS